jgi:hypothetical protein
MSTPSGATSDQPEPGPRFVEHDDPEAVHALAEPDVPMSTLMVCGRDGGSAVLDLADRLAAAGGRPLDAGVTCPMCATGIERAGDPPKV